MLHISPLYIQLDLKCLGMFHQSTSNLYQTSNLRYIIPSKLTYLEPYVL